MSVSSKLSMHISFQEFEFSEEAVYPRTDVACAVFLNDNCIDKLYLNKDSVGKLALTNPDDRLRFIFRSKQTGAIIGCISFLLKAFYSQVDKQFNQWLTLFDCPEDDEFDGEFGEDDEETPRVLFQYQILSDDLGSDNENTPKKQQKTLNRTDTEFSDIQHKYHSNMSYVSGITEFGSPVRDNQRMFQEEPQLYSDKKNVDVEENMISVAPQFQYSFHHHPEEMGKDHNSYIETKETPRLEPKQDVIMENKGIFYLEQQQKEVEIEPLIGSVQAISERSNDQQEYQVPVQVRLETNDEGQYLLYLENERNTKLQEILKVTENRLANIETAYKDLDAKSRIQTEGLVDKNKVLNQDNQNLREKVQELEENLEKVLEKASEHVEAYSEKCSRQLDLAGMEDYRTKNQTLEKLNLSLKEELTRIKSLCHQEKELNQNMQEQLKNISNQYKQDINEIKEENSAYVEQLNQLSEELFMSREKYAKLDLELSSVVTVKDSLERELQIKSKTIASLKKEAQDYQELTEDLRKTIREFKANNEREIAILRQNIAVLEDKIRDQDKSSKETQEYIREMQREIDCFQAKGYDERVNALMEEVKGCEATIKDLKEIIENCKCGSNECMKTQSETESDRDKRAKLHEKFQTLTYQYQEQMIKMQAVRNENFELSTRIEDLEREKEQYGHYLEQLKPLQDENEQLWGLLSRMKNHLALNAAELVNQAGQVITQKAVIKNLNQKLQPSDIKVLKPQPPQPEAKQNKNEDFKRSQVNKVKNVEAQAQKANIQSHSRPVEQSKQNEERKEDKEIAKHAKENVQTGVSSQESSKIENTRTENSKLKGSEIDQKLKELMKKTKILMKFVRIGEGVYVFGSKRVQVRSIDGKLVIKIKGGYMLIEEFIRLFTHQELTKLKTMKGEISYTNIEDENLPTDADKAHIISDNVATDQDSFRANSGNTNNSLSLQCSPIKEEVTGKKMLIEGMRSASISHRGNEPNWPLKKELDSNRETASTTHRSKESARTRHTKGAPSVEFSPRFQQHEDDVRKWASNNHSEQKSFRETNTGKKEFFRK